MSHIATHSFIFFLLIFPLDFLPLAFYFLSMIFHFHVGFRYFLLFFSLLLAAVVSLVEMYILLPYHQRPPSPMTFFLRSSAARSTQPYCYLLRRRHAQQFSSPGAGASPRSTASRCSPQIPRSRWQSFAFGFQMLATLPAAAYASLAFLARQPGLLCAFSVSCCPAQQRLLSAAFIRV